MGRLRLSDSTLAGMGFRRVELDEGLHCMVYNLSGGRTIECIDGTIELAHGGYAVPLQCRGKEHLELLIKVL